LIGFENSVFVEYLQWAEEDKKIFDRINTLIKEISRNPFSGIGKPEPLKGDWSGYWSRRITQEHRLIYKVFSDHNIVIVSCKNHY